MAHGYNGRILRVNLTTGRTWIEQPDDEFYRRYMGGRAFAAYYLLREVPPGIDPLDPRNLLVFAVSVVTGAHFPGNAKYTAAAKSPLTGGYGEAEAGGFFGPELKFAGYDAVVIEGKAGSPSYLWICNGEAEIRKADHLWGLTTGETEDAICTELGDNRIRVACIGPAGERLVRYASIMTGSSHANGRMGMGTVMGAKYLKAVAVRGSGKVEVNDPTSLRRLAQWFADNFRQDPTNLGMSEYGTSGSVISNNELGLLPTRNFREGAFEGALKITGQTLKEQGYVVGREACFSCPVACKRIAEVKENPRFAIERRYGGPEYETIAALGSDCGVDDAEAVLKGNELCNKLGMDTISTGATIAFAMECHERGLLSEEDFGLDRPGFGNGAAMVELINMIACRQGIGDLLAEGVRRAAARIGKGAERYAVHSKGEEVAMQEPRGKAGAGLGYAVGPQGGDHIQMEFDFLFEKETKFLTSVRPLGVLDPVPAMDMGPKKVALFTNIQTIWSFYNVLDMCIFVGAPGHTYGLDHLVEIVKAVTGWDTSICELMKVGERALTMCRAFNIREGMGFADDWLPARLLEPIVGGAIAGAKISEKELREAIGGYYNLMGWEAGTGVPMPWKLQELDIEWVAAHIASR